MRNEINIAAGIQKVFWLLLLCCNSLFAQTDYYKSPVDSNALKRYNDALKMIREGKEKQGLKILKKFSDRERTFYQAHMTLGYFYQERKDVPAAIEYFNRALVAYPTSAIAFFNRGNCYLKQKKYNLAVGDFNQAIRHDSLLFAAYNNLAVTRLMNQGGGQLRESELELAKENLKKFESIKPLTDPAMIMNLGVIYLHLFAFKEAIPYFDRAAAIDSLSGKPYYYRGLCYYYLRNYTEARSNFVQSYEAGFNKEQAREFINFIDYIFEKLTGVNKKP
jgi:tetratricopeptide (TPR) repeat protein